MLAQVHRFFTGLQGRIIVFSSIIVLIFILFLSNIYNFQQKRVLQESFEKEISPFLFPVQNLVLEMDYYADRLIQLEQFRILEEKKYQMWIKKIKEEDPELLKKNRELLFRKLPENKKKFYQLAKEKLIQKLEEVYQKPLEENQLRLLFRYASILARAEIRGEKKRYLKTRKKFDEIIRYVYSYQKKQKKLFQGLDFNQYRIESINLLRWQRFDTRNLSIVKEQSPINQIQWQEPVVKRPLDIVYQNYQDGKPLLKPYRTQFVFNQNPYFLILKTIYQNPGISERSKKILLSLQSRDRYKWIRLAGKINTINKEIKKVYENILLIEQRNQNRKEVYKNKEYRKNIQFVKNLLRKKRQILKREAYQILKNYDHFLLEIYLQGEKLRQEIRMNQKKLTKLSLHNTDARVPLIKKINQLKKDLQKLEEKKAKINFNKNLQIVDAYLYLPDYVIYRNIFLEYKYDPNRYTDYVKSYQVRKFYRQLFKDIENWILSPFERKTFRKYANRGFFIVDQKEAREIFFHIHLKDLQQLAKESLIENTTGFTRIIANMKDFLHQSSREKSYFIDTAIAIGIRIIFLAILFTRILTDKIQNIIKQVLKIGEGNLDIHLPYRGNDEISQLAISINSMVKGLKEREELKKELNAAEEIQKRLLPSSFPENVQNHLEISAFYKAMNGVGGDYYDFIEANSLEMVFVMADVSNHGVGPALIMTLMRSRLHSIVRSGITDPFTIALELNSQLYKETPSEIFITAFIGSYHKQTGILRYVSSGHLPSLLIRNHKINFLPAGGLPLAAVDNELYKTMIKKQKLDFKNQDMFFLYTDGLIEAMNSKGELFGEERLERILRLHVHLEPERLIRMVIQEVEKFTGKRILTTTAFSELNDDIALVVMKKR